MQPATEISHSMPAPIGGWNARDAIDLMPPQDAVRLINLVPNASSVDIRKGFREHSTGLGSSVVETLAEFVGADGTKKLIGMANGNWYDATTFEGTATSLGSGFTSNQWQTIMANDRLIGVNGTDQPQQYDGTTLSAANYTGIADDSVLNNVTSYRARLYFTEKDSTKFYYTGVSAITGAITEFDTQTVLKLGGFLQNIASWTLNTGSGIDEHLVLISNMGEGLVYAGTFPGSSTWRLIGRFLIPVPIGKRAVFQLGTDTVVITQQGVIPLSPTMFSAGQSGTYERLTDKINDAFNQVARLHRSTFGWQALVYPRAQLLYINIPVQAGSQYDQYVMNTYTGSWCQFKNHDAVSWVIHNEKPYFGGINGKVFEADVGFMDDNANISIDLKTAFNYFGDRNRLKQFLLARPIIIANNDLFFDFDMDVDGADTPLSGTISTQDNTGVGIWDESAWDDAKWDQIIHITDWYSVCGLGRSGSLKLKGDFKNVDFQISSFHINFSLGNIL